MRRVLLVNPLIHDFAAYDFWALPLGLLQLASLLEACDDDLQLQLLDCVDPGSPWLPPALRPRRPDGGRGKLARTPLARPRVLPDIGRRYSRYGLPPEAVRHALAAQPQPDLVLLTSMMTYWYPGVIETIDLIKERWPGVPLILGGVYASLCTAHARASARADLVVPGPLERCAEAVLESLGCQSAPWSLQACLPCHRLLARRKAAALLTSSGCPRSCPYCGVHALHPRYRCLSPERVEREVRHLVCELEIPEIAIYDDTFTFDEERAFEILGRIAAVRATAAPFRLHAASGLGCRGITARLAMAMQRAGFVTIRLGLETSDPTAQQLLGGKVTNEELTAALEHLEAAGYRRRDIGVYVMAGLPGQPRRHVEQSLDFVLGHGARPHLAEYSPVPGSPLFEAARAAAGTLDLSEPLTHNPTLLPCGGPDLDRQALAEIKLQLQQRLHHRDAPAPASTG